MNDRQLAQKIAAGDHAAAERFVGDYYAATFRMLRHLTGSREDAEDLTQQTFLVARAKIDRFRGDAGLKTWLHRIAYNEYAQWKRRRRPTAPLTLEQAIVEPGFGSFIEGETLLRALSKLSDKHRETFILHEVEELTVEEIAKLLSIPGGTVKARLFHARRRLKAFFEEGTEVHYEPKESTL